MPYISALTYPIDVDDLAKRVIDKALEQAEFHVDESGLSVGDISRKQDARYFVIILTTWQHEALKGVTTSEERKRIITICSRAVEEIDQINDPDAIDHLVIYLKKFSR
jgi:hypothetical protein